MEISRRSLLVSTAFGAGLLLAAGPPSMANAHTQNLAIGTCEGPGLHDQAVQEVATDSDDGYRNDGNPRHYEWWHFDLFTASGLKAAVILIENGDAMLPQINARDYPGAGGAKSRRLQAFCSIE